MITQIINGKEIKWGGTFKFIVKVNHLYIKHTSEFGCFHGSIVLTDKKREAKMFTRRQDAKIRASTLKFRYTEFDHVRDKFKRIYQFTKLPKLQVIKIEI